MHYKIQNWVSRPNINDFRQGEKSVEKLFFPHFGFGLKTRSQFRSACKSQREISSDKVGRLLWSLWGKYAGKGGGMVYGEGEMQ